MMNWNDLPPSSDGGDTIKNYEVEIGKAFDIKLVNRRIISLQDSKESIEDIIVQNEEALSFSFKTNAERSPRVMLQTKRGCQLKGFG